MPVHDVGTADVLRKLISRSIAHVDFEGGLSICRPNSRLQAYDPDALDESVGGKDEISVVLRFNGFRRGRIVGQKLHVPGFYQTTITLRHLDGERFLVGVFGAEREIDMDDEIELDEFLSAERPVA